MRLVHLVPILAFTGCSISGASFSHGNTSDDTTGGDDDDDGGGGGGTEGNITIRIYVGANDIGITENAETVWLRDGAGAWQVVDGTGGIYHANVTSDRFTIVAACTVDQNATMTVAERVVRDGPIVSIPRCAFAPPSITVSCTATALGSSGYMVSSAQDAALTNDGSAIGVRAPAGPTELFATKILSGVSQSVIRHSGLDLAANPTAAFNFAAEGAAVAVFTVASNDTASFVNSFVNTPTGSYRIQDELASPQPSLTYAALPASLLQADDLMEVTWLGTGGRTTTKLTRGGQVELDVMTQPTIVQPTLDSSNTLRPVFTLPIQPAALAEVHYELGTLTNAPGGVSRTWLAIVSDAWVQATNAKTYTPPVFDELPGYDSTRYALVTGGLSGAQVIRSESSTNERVLGREVRTTMQQFLLSGP